MISSRNFVTVKNVIPKIATLTSEWESEEWIRNEIIMLNEFLIHNGIKKIVDDKKRMDLQYDLTKPMQSHYRNEDIYYSTPLTRIKQYQVFTYEGMLYDCHGTPVNTKPLNFETGAILVMTQEGTLFLAHKERGMIHHSTLLASAPVAYACMLEVSEGRIIKEAAWSGHYEPTIEQQAQFHDRLNKNCFHEIPNNLVPIFLSTMNNLNSHEICPISRMPLIEPVKLPCGHVYNLSSFLQWHEKNKICPIDGTEIEIKEILSDEDLISKSKDTYLVNHLKLKSYISDLDSKVIQLGLDDRSENLTTLSTFSRKSEVILFLTEDSPVSRIYEIAKSIGLSFIDSISKVSFFLNSRSVNPNKKLSEIIDTNNRVTRVYLLKG